MVHQQVGERNFHSFYSLIHGTSESELNEFFLKAKNLEKFTYLNQGGKLSNEQADDKHNYRLVNEAMKISNFEPELIRTIWSIVASIIHLGNIIFESTEKEFSKLMNSPAKISDESLRREIKIISNLLGLNETELAKSLTSRLIASGSKDVVTKEFTMADANYARDAFAKVGFKNKYHELERKDFIYFN